MKVKTNHFMHQYVSQKQPCHCLVLPSEPLTIKNLDNEAVEDVDETKFRRMHHRQDGCCS